MIRRIVVALIVLAIIGGAAFWFLTTPKALAEGDLPQHTADVEHGKYLFNIGGCANCHADPSITDTSKVTEMGGGLALGSPFGTFYAPNISLDKEHGIGNWSALDFVNAVKFGVTPAGEHLYPAFPYYSYQRMKVEDILDLKAYLDTLPPVANDPPKTSLPFPFSIRRGVGLWKLLYIDGETFQPDPAASDEINHGAYLVRGPGHCGECHTPRNLILGPDESRALAGGPSLEGRGSVPNITPDKETGIGKMTLDDFMFNVFTFGMNIDGKPISSGGMGKVLRELQALPEADQRAIVAYLMSRPPVRSAKPAADEAKPAAKPDAGPEAAAQ